MDTIADFSRKYISFQPRGKCKSGLAARLERVGYLGLLPISIRRFRIHFLAFPDIQTSLEKIRDKKSEKSEGLTKEPD